MASVTSILFVGNSLTSMNGGVDAQMRVLSPATRIAAVATPGHSLEAHWLDGQALDIIQEGNWDCVVLQEQSGRPVSEPAKFREFVKKFDAEVTKNGGKTVLWMTWGRPESSEAAVTTAEVAEAYNAVGNQVEVQVAPVGLAVARAYSAHAEPALAFADGHPTAAGTYLAACVLYATIFGKNPPTNAAADPTLSAETKKLLQTMAAGVGVFN